MCFPPVIDILPSILPNLTQRIWRAEVKNRALVDEKSRPYFSNEAIGISIQNQDSICVNLGLYVIIKEIGFYWELVVSVFRDPIILY